MGDNLNQVVWRAIAVDGSRADEIIADVNHGRTRPYDAHVILDAIDELANADDITFKNFRWYRSAPGSPPAGQLQARVWETLKVEGSTSGELVKDLNAPLAVPFQRHEILDVLDSLVDQNLVVLDGGKYRRGSRVRNEGDGVVSWVAGGYASRIEERLDLAWPRAGGRREIVRALADEVEEMMRERESGDDGDT